ncbi:MAG: TerB family tellurite resistance protein [Planctomycetota bacterium]
MIIFGWRGVTYTKDNGEFYCPHCSGQCQYRLKRVRNFFTLYFIPLIPLNLLGEFIECAHCGNQYAPEVLAINPQTIAAAQQQAAEQAVNEARDAYFIAVRRVMVETMVAKGHVTDAERSEVAAAFAELSGQELSVQDLDHEISQAQRETAAISALRQLAPGLNEKGKENVLFAAYRIAMADGQIADEEWALIAEVGEALQMTPSHINGAIAEAEVKYGRPTFD